MSVQTLYTAATGMESLQTKLDVIANNLANVNTTGFKAGRANFEDLFYRTDEFPGKQDAQGNLTAVGTQIGLGARVTSVQTDLRQGAFQETGESLDVAIEGKGLFRVTDPVTNLPLYTRAGNFSINAQGQLVIGSAQTGRLIDPAISFDQTTQAISISPDGQVFAQLPGQTQLSNVGTLQLATFKIPKGCSSWARTCTPPPMPRARSRRSIRASKGRACCGRAFWKRQTSSRCINSST
jgi:flagellar basal-body rod protein FlgG